MGINAQMNRWKSIVNAWWTAIFDAVAKCIANPSAPTSGSSTTSQCAMETNATRKAEKNSGRDGVHDGRNRSSHPLASPLAIGWPTANGKDNANKYVAR